MTQLRLPPVKPGRGPAHAQIEATLERALDRGLLASGDRLPAERELAERFGVSRMTLRQALGALEQRGRLKRSKGRYGGTFVAVPKLELAGTSGFSDQLRGLGVAAGAVLLQRNRARRDTGRGSCSGDASSRSNASVSQTASPSRSSAARTPPTPSPACSRSSSTALSTS